MKASAQLLEEYLTRENDLSSFRASVQMQCLGSIYAWLDDKVSLARHGQRSLERLGDISDPIVAHRFAIVFLARPVSDSLIKERVLELGAFIGERAEGHKYSHRFRLSGGATEFRSGRFENVADCVSEPEDSDVVEVRVPGLCFHAMAEHQLGNLEIARQLLAQAEADMKQLPALDAHALGNDWHDELICFVVFEEARGLILSE